MYSVATRSILVLSLLFFTAQTAFAGAIEDARPDTPPTVWNDVKAWKPLGTRWAGALNAKDEIIAIYDLSYPNLLSYLPIGIVGGKQADKAKIIDMIIEAKLNPDVDPAQADQVISDLKGNNSTGPLEDGTLPKQWWKQVAWNGTQGGSESEPMSFKLSDLNLGLKGNDAVEFKKAISDVEKALNEIEEPGFGDGLLSKIEFLRVSDGTYEMHFGVKALAGVTKPRKVADIASPKAEFWNAMMLDLAKKALAKVLGMIPGNIAKAVISTALDRLFHFHNLAHQSHQLMALEMLNAAYDGEASAFQDGLTKAEIQKAIESLAFAQTSMGTAYQWLWKKPFVEWTADVKKNENLAKLCIDWTTNHKVSVTSINKRFAFSLDSATQAKKLLLLSKAKPNEKKGPFAAIDYAKPEGTYQLRLLTEVGATALLFGSNFIPNPMIGNGLVSAFKSYIEKPMDNSKFWEARLTVQLEAMGDSAAGELAVIDHQRINPFFQSRENMNALIKARKQLMGL